MDSMLLLLTFVSLLAALAFGVVTWRLMADERRRSAARVAALAAAIDGTTADVPDRAGLFDSSQPSAVRGRPLLKLGVGFAMAVALIVFIAMSADRRTGDVAPPATQVQDSLELLSMRHARNGDALTVTGLVRNPRSVTAQGITAVVFAFDRDGGFVASGRAPLEFATLAPGDESPFQVTVPDVSNVGRYRVSFRTDTGVVRHLDRRPAAAALLTAN